MAARRSGWTVVAMMGAPIALSGPPPAPIRRDAQLSIYDGDEPERVRHVPVEEPSILFPGVLAVRRMVGKISLATTKATDYVDGRRHSMERRWKAFRQMMPVEEQTPIGLVTMLACLSTTHAMLPARPLLRRVALIAGCTSAVGVLFYPQTAQKILLSQFRSSTATPTKGPLSTGPTAPSKGTTPAPTGLSAYIPAFLQRLWTRQETPAPAAGPKKDHIVLQTAPPGHSLTEEIEPDFGQSTEEDRQTYTSRK